MENLKGYKTIIFGMLIAALGAVQATDLAQVVPNEWIGIVMSAIGGMIMVLRALTDTSVGSSE